MAFANYATQHMVTLLQGVMVCVNVLLLLSSLVNNEL